MLNIDNIQELQTLEDIEDAELKYEELYGKTPFSLSTWNPSQYYKDNVLMNHVMVPICDIPIDYIYSYELEKNITTPVLKRLIGEKDSSFIVTNSGTASIALVTSVLAEIGCHSLLVISPTYFAVLYNCKQKNIRTFETHMIHESGTYRLPRKTILEKMKQVDAIWLTNPVYNAGVYLEYEDIIFLENNVLTHKYLVADECFSHNGNSLMFRFSNCAHFIGIYDPLKQFLINGLKFSVITFSSDLEQVFCQWSDIVCGSLTTSTIQAMKFFVSENADVLLTHISEYNEHIQEKVRFALSGFRDIHLDRYVNGHMLMCYLPMLTSKHLSTTSDFLNFQLHTGTSIIPGERFHFASQDGFSFRINLARYDPFCFERSIIKAIEFLIS